MKKDFLTFAKGGFVLLDGGFGTELQRAGLPAGTMLRGQKKSWKRGEYAVKLAPC